MSWNACPSTSNIQSVSKLAFFLLILPCLSTIIYYHNLVVRHDLVFVRAKAKDPALQSLEGIYRYDGPTDSFTQRQKRPLSRRLEFLGLFLNPTLPIWDLDLSFLHLLRSSRGSDLPGELSPRNRRNQGGTKDGGLLWCLENTYCGSTPNAREFSSLRLTRGDDPSDDKNVVFYVSRPSQWVVTTSWPSFSSSFASSDAKRVASGLSFRRNPNRQSSGRRNPTIDHVLRRPATTLLLGLNVGLAAFYYLWRVTPSSVSKIYSRMMLAPHYEIWRGLTGATAHFEPLHLGFNMMALLALGTELEEDIVGPIRFLLYNLSLILITTMLMMMAVKIQMHAARNDNARQQQLMETSTVGYSGVLFAWMVVSSLERNRTCPVFFMPKLCFPTYTITRFLKFNLGPFVQLVVAQVLLPRVSFVGHLAGVVAGFALTWGCLPLSLVQPTMLLPSLLLLHFWNQRRIIPSTDLSTSNTLSFSRTWSVLRSEPSSVRRGSETESSFENGRRQRDDLFQRVVFLPWLFQGVFIVFQLSVLGVAESWAVLLPLLPQALLGWYCLSSHATLRSLSGPEYQQEKETRSGPLWRALVVCLVLNTILYSMTVGAEWYLRSSTMATLGIVWLGRFALQFLMLFFACKHLSDIGQTGGGIFVATLGWTVLDPSRTIGSHLLGAALQHHRRTVTATQHAQQIAGDRSSGRPTNRIDLPSSDGGTLV